MRKRLLFVVVAALVVVGCRKDPIEPPDPYEAFKADDTPRWESGSTVERNEKTTHTYITDTGGQLFGTAKYKTGRITTADGSSYEFIEFSGAPAVGKPTEPTIRKPLGVTDLHSLEILKKEGNLLWIVFKETSTSPERRVVQ